MKRVGIRELRQNASMVIRQVVSGETIEITERGHPVAKIVPLQTESVLEQMVAEGLATHSGGDILDVQPLPAQPGKPALSSVLDDMRRDER